MVRLRNVSTYLETNAFSMFAMCETTEMIVAAVKISRVRIPITRKVHCFPEQGSTSLIAEKGSGGLVCDSDL